MESKQDSRMSAMDGTLLARNGLYYKMPQTLSTTDDRSFRKEYAQRQSYSPGDTMVFDWNTGTSYVDPSNAMLTFSFTVNTTNNPNAGDTFSFGTGAGAASLIQEIRIMSKNGTEVDRTLDANVLAKITKDWTYSASGVGNLGMTYTPAAAFGTGTYQAAIPMRLISGFFRPTVSGMMLPAGLASGLRIEMVLAPAARAFSFTSGGGGSSTITYTVTDPEMLLMLHQLNDPTQAVLMATSQQNGLEYTFPAYFSTTISTNTTTINEQIKKAVSNCTKAFATVYNVSGANSVLLETKDGFDTAGEAAITNYQFRVGSSYYPVSSVDAGVEAWFVTSAAFSKQADMDKTPNSVTFETYAANKLLLGVPLATSDRLNVSGLPINNSSVLEFRCTSVNGGNLTRQWVIFMEYTAVTRTFLNKTDLKI